ncbi:glycerophosphodiester phosphodiesterase [Mammaliicoccus sciuri]|uniref:glycerophosphodiester phosphodiesterase n=1 Tax=Mammaliicoccus sciuri TaxID=1296 RepID=UPI002B261408|nr:glycerophosphodiester phosphodiesterase family protein [Mammaliicoccus sciuri]WQK64492.1 glycerophosphodiester phosphodiesterase family protein [Mammaliicoccus sciuri]
MNVYNQNCKLKVAHRGVPSLAPENTMISFKRAIEFNIDVLEIDIHRTIDGELVVIHDPTMNRTSLEKGVISKLTYEALKKYDVGKWIGQAYIGEQIPLFQDVLKLIKDTHIKLLIEIKQPENYPNIEVDIITKIKQHDIPHNQIMIQSFNRKSIQKINILWPEIELGVLIKKKDRFISKRAIKKIGEYANYINPNYKIVTIRFVKVAHASHLKILPYTVNDKHTAEKMLAMGVDGLISDYAHLLDEWMKS